jgi:polysaccharide export outer membrane protein
MMSRRVRAVGAMTIVAVLAGCASSGTYVWADEYTATEAPGGYVVAPGDVLTIQVWDNDKISTHAVVRRDGNISVPLLNDVDVGGKAPAAIAREIEQRLKDANLITSPRVTVTVEQSSVAEVSVLGAVTKAGTYPIDRGDGVAEALAKAGGLTEFAHKDDIYLVRRRPTLVRIRFTFASATGESGKAVLFPLQPGDVITVE